MNRRAGLVVDKIIAHSARYGRSDDAANNEIPLSHFETEVRVELACLQLNPLGLCPAHLERTRAVRDSSQLSWNKSESLSQRYCSHGQSPESRHAQKIHAFLQNS